MAQLRNPNVRNTLFPPFPHHRKRHMLHIVVLKENAFQVIDHHVDGPVGGVPQAGVVTPSRGDDFQLHKRLLKIRKRALSGRLLDSTMDHRFPVLLDGLRQPFHGGQRLLNGQNNLGPAVRPTCYLPGKGFLLCRTAKGFRVVNQRQELALKPEGLGVSSLHFRYVGALFLQQIPADRNQRLFNVDIHEKPPPPPH